MALAAMVMAVLCLASCRRFRARHLGRRSWTIERLYSLPWLIGTQPKGFEWSPDSQQLAFLWNDDGGNFYDVWAADVKTGRPVRITQRCQGRNFLPIPVWTLHCFGNKLPRRRIPGLPP